MPDLIRTLSETVHYPPHPPRKPTALYTRTHHRLVQTLDSPCLVCGVRNSTLGDPLQNRWGATQLETHHKHIEDSLALAIDLDKFNTVLRPGLLRRTQDESKYNHVFTQAEMEEWIHGDEDNLWVLCLTGDSPVLMADGTEKPLQSIVVGDVVISHDGQAHPVTHTTSKYVQETLCVIDGVKMTKNHLILSAGGWVTAESLSVGDIVYQLGVVQPQMLGLGSTQHQILQTVVTSKMVNMVDPLCFQKPPADMDLHDVNVLQDRTTMIPFPNKPSDITPRHMAAKESLSPHSGLLIKRYHAARVGTVSSPPRGSRSKDMERSSANSTINGYPPSSSVLFANTTARARTGSISLCKASGCLKHLPADATSDSSPGVVCTVHAGWRPIRHVHTLRYSGYVYDISVAHSHSYVSSTLVVHNCDVHHRHTLVGIHAITAPIWGVQNLIKDDFDLTGYTAHSPEEANALTNLPQTTGSASFKRGKSHATRKKQTTKQVQETSSGTESPSQ